MEYEVIMKKKNNKKKETRRGDYVNRRTTDAVIVFSRHVLRIAVLGRSRACISV
jgi:hypothetical protein